MQTNLAATLDRNPGLAHRLDRVAVMGGVLGPRADGMALAAESDHNLNVDQPGRDELPQCRLTVAIRTVQRDGGRGRHPRAPRPTPPRRPVVPGASCPNRTMGDRLRKTPSRLFTWIIHDVSFRLGMVRRPHDPLVAGSSPAGPTKRTLRVRQVEDHRSVSVAVGGGCSVQATLAPRPWPVRGLTGFILDHER
jgi:hypothetical protein